MPSNRDRRFYIALAAAASVTLLSKALLERFPHLAKQFLCGPSAHIASLMTGSPLQKLDTGNWLLFPPIGEPQIVSLACSGSGFTSILLGLVIWARLDPKSGLTALVWPLLIAYPFALLTNAIRISLSGLVAAIAVASFGDNYKDIAHMALGSLLFLSSLLIFNTCLHHANRIHKTKHPACPSIS